MSLQFTYEFGGSPVYTDEEGIEYTEGEPYTYQADYTDAVEYLIRTHGTDELIKDYIDNKYDEETEEDKETLKSYDRFNGTYDSIDNMSEETKEDLLKEVLFNLLYDMSIYDDELKDYYEQTAYDEWEEQIG